ncbi:MAG: transporter substrate-binding domain-containing protein, partial [Flavobacteriales bacterium]
EKHMIDLKGAFWTVALAFFFPAAVFGARTTTARTDSSMLRVAMAGTAPFVTGQGTGISVDIWNATADALGLHYTSVSFANVPDALEALQAVKVDVVVGPVSITSGRAVHMELSQPWFRSSLSILSRSEGLGLWDRISPFFSPKLAYALVIFLFILACVGTLLWLAERKASPKQFPPDPMRGIGNGMWCAIVTMSTTGYGDIAPVTLKGRIVAGSWMVVSLLFATTMVASIASTLTLTGLGRSVIDTAEDLSGKRIAVLEDSPAEDFVKEQGGIPVPMADLGAGYAALDAKEVKAVVFDRPQLLYFLKEKHNKKMAVSKAQFEPQGYGFAFPINDPLVRKVDVQLLKMKESGELDRTFRQWLGNEWQ